MHMPLTHSRTFRVRYYECDANGHLNGAMYLRYMQETAFDASAAAGYDMKRYSQMQHHWLIRESQVEYLRPLVYNQQVTVSTWIADFRRVTSRRAYEFRLAGTGELAARAFTDWVYLDTTSNQPASIPRSLVEDFYPEGAPAEFTPRRPFPASPHLPAGVFRMRRQVRWQDIDALQHVNNAVYMDYTNECGFQVCAAFHWPWQRMNEEGFAIYLRQARLQYLQPAVLGDELEIATWISEVRRATSGRHYTIQRASDGALLAQAYTLGAWVDLQSGQPIRIPQDMLDDFAPNIAHPK
jgi:acyl-CoA thioester hydrolase